LSNPLETYCSIALKTNQAAVASALETCVFNVEDGFWITLCCNTEKCAVILIEAVLSRCNDFF
jgi:hypothetical protein